ncbi:MAG: hypothetical protein QME52_09655 [Bacteroidota bacterium]|nr:hypothetical protein [Bacteroidota bacterium]
MSQRKIKIFIDLIIVCFVLASIIGIGCNTKINDKGVKDTMPTRDINVVKDAHTEELMKLPGVVGVYVGELDDGTPCIGVMVDILNTDLENKIPKAIEGHPVRIDETGEIKPMK